jgi:nucleoside-diphosphate-sugar epimerase
MNSTALIGATGFVGSNLATQNAFADCFNSSNIDRISGREYELVVCAGIQAKKWWANQHPQEDWNGIANLLRHLETIRAQRFILVSTIDVYPSPSNVDENHSADTGQNHAYGLHRFHVEEFVRECFASHLIVRLPGLFGRGITKNVIHDLLSDHELEKINPSGVYQYYDLQRLWSDMEKAISLGLKLLNISTEPLSTREIADALFPNKPLGPESAFKASYDMRSIYWRDWGSDSPGYLYAKSTVLKQLAVFIEEQTSDRP